MNLSNFGERLKELVDDNENTAASLGEKLGVGNSAISHYITGRNIPSLRDLLLLADYFKCTSDYLLGLTDYNGFHAFKTCPPFGERLLILCRETGISRYKLQKLTGIAESTMRYWVQGKTTPSVPNVIAIAEKLGFSVDYVLGREQ